jgi:hypothetical protein
MEISNFIDFMYLKEFGTFLKPHTILLNHITEASSLLTISKDILIDEAILTTAFPTLNPR